MDVKPTYLEVVRDIDSLLRDNRLSWAEAAKVLKIPSGKLESILSGHLNDVPLVSLLSYKHILTMLMRK